VLCAAYAKTEGRFETNQSMKNLIKAAALLLLLGDVSVGAMSSSQGVKGGNPVALRAKATNYGTPVLVSGELVAIPEPQTWATLIGGLGTLGFWRKMRRRNA
jgi:hypothetical protein